MRLVMSSLRTPRYRVSVDSTISALVDETDGYAIPDQIGRPLCNHGEPPGRALAKQGQICRLDAAGEVVEVRGAVTVVNVLVEAERGLGVDQIQAGSLVE